MAVPTAPAVCGHSRPTSRSGYVNGVRFDPVSASELAERIAEFLNCGSSHVVHFGAAHPIVLARNDEAYRELLNRRDLKEWADAAYRINRAGADLV